jgi:hypothetical protein
MVITNGSHSLNQKMFVDFSHTRDVIDTMLARLFFLGELVKHTKLSIHSSYLFFQVKNILYLHTFLIWMLNHCYFTDS